MVMRRNPVPIGPRVVVKLKKKEVVSQGGIILETDAQTQKSKYATQEAYIVNISPNAFADWYVKPELKEGDLVKIIKYSGENDTTIEEGEIYQTINDVDIITQMKGEGLND